MIRPQHPSRPPSLPHPAFRKRLSAERRREISLVHHVNLDTLARGDPSCESLLDFVGTVLTWHRVAVRLGRGELEMRRQLDLMERLLERFERTGQARFEEKDYEFAREGVVVMDLLAGEVDMATADAWVNNDATKIGFEVSFIRHFCKPQPSRTLSEISADILAIEKEAEGLLDGMLVEATQP